MILHYAAPSRSFAWREVEGWRCDCRTLIQRPRTWRNYLSIARARSCCCRAYEGWVRLLSETKIENLRVASQSRQSPVATRGRRSVAQVGRPWQNQ